MKLSWRKFGALFTVLLISAPIVSQAQIYERGNSHAQGADLRISLLTFGPGRIYWERFGHDAILVQDLANGTNIDYNYGVFDFDQKNFFQNFVRGNMTYRISADLLSNDLAMYKAEGRSVTQQILNLTPSQRAFLKEYLEWNSLPQNARYHYDYFTSNCATRVRDALNAALHGALRRQLATIPAPHRDTYRKEAVRLISPDLWLAMGMDLALGPAADRPLSMWQAAFIPMVLSSALNQISLHSAGSQHSYPLIAKTRTLLRARIAPPPREMPHWFLPFAAIGFGLSALLILLVTQRQRVSARIIFSFTAFACTFFYAVGGLILIAMWIWTDHWATWGNHNLLLLNPLCILLLPCWLSTLRSHWRPSRWYIMVTALNASAAAISLFLHILPIKHQDNLNWIFLILPVHVALYAALIQMRRSVAATPNSDSVS